MKKLLLLIALAAPMIAAAQTDTTAPPMPIKLISFDVKATAEANVLSWKAYEDIEAVSYTVQRSKTANNFESLVTIPATQKQYAEYDYKDANTGSFFYRLKLRNSNGGDKYSAVVSVVNDSKMNFFVTVQGSRFYFNTIDPAKEANVRIYTMEGALVSDSGVTPSVPGLYVYRVSQGSNAAAKVVPVR